MASRRTIGAVPWAKIVICTSAVIASLRFNQAADGYGDRSDESSIWHICISVGASIDKKRDNGDGGNDANDQPNIL